MIIHTNSGHKVSIQSPDPATLDIADIAHNLARINRFNGATKVPYSVASHCVWVSRVVPQHCALSGLLHDASEAYIGDIIAPLKPLLRDYNYIEERFDNAVGRKFGVSIGLILPGEVRDADRIAALLEMFALEHPAYDYSAGMPIAGRDTPPIIPQTPEAAEKAFLARYYELTEGK